MGIDRTDTGAGVVDGTRGDDTIDANYRGDPQCDAIDGGDARLPGESGDQDVVNAGDGDDIVLAGADDDEVFGGAGDDSLDGGAGNDLLLGDRDTADNGPTREVFKWSEAPDPHHIHDKWNDIDDGDKLRGFTQDTGKTEVTFSGTSTGPTVYSEDKHLVAGLDTGNLPAPDAKSALDNVLSKGGCSSYKFDFSNSVEDVAFRINDVDGDGVVQVRAFDADGNATTVNLTAGACVTLLDRDSVAGADTADSRGGYGDNTDPAYSVLVEIPGPVARIEVEHTQNGPQTSGIKITDIYYDTVQEVASGDDTLNGGEGDDSLLGEGGEDVMTGGAGADQIWGGDDADLIIGGTAGDMVDGGAGGDDDDTLDLSGSGPLRIVGQTTDADGNSTSGTVEFLDHTGAVTGTMTFTEIENLILPDLPERDGIVSGTAGNDVIDLSYTGDPDGDRIDANDAILGDVGSNDDIVEAGAGDDTVRGRDGDDTLYGGTGDDSMSGDAGDDSLNGGAGNDTLKGGTGDDSLIGGDGKDIILGGDGQDTALGGDGDDFIDTSAPLTGSNTPLPDDGFNDPAGVPADPDTENDRDLVSGGAGNDTIFTGDDADTITGGAGDDVIFGGLDDDEIDAGEGDDLVIGGEGSDAILGGDGNDTIYGGIKLSVANIPDAIDPELDNGDDYIDGGAGDDLIFGEDDNDTILGGSGDDTLDGGIDDDLIQGQDGDDSILGGKGDDILIGGAGADDMSGGTGRDTFIIASAEDGNGDNADGGSGGDDFDTLDLTGAGPYKIVGETVDADGNSTSGTINFLDAPGGAVTGSMTFQEIERIIPCFTPGTVIATPKGERLVEELQVGDRIITRDNGLQEIRWLGRRDLEGAELLQAPQLRPVLIRAGSLGRGLPERDLLVSPNHRVLINNEKTALYFEDREVLAAAKHLTDLEGVDAVDTSAISYIHFMFDQHEVVLSNGSWTESFQPGEQTLDDMDDAQRGEIYALFPELRDLEGIEAYQAARRSLKRHEARLLTR
ncbi:Hint domain-containing protein [Roseovarius sp. S1116L3]|uniref:Hint domain-containing protein n=1 Tax=Roseovarius roseus TaxID=3342636 RepID=UPI00372654E0